MKTLVVAEKPSVGRDIARVLGVKGSGNGFLASDTHVVTWAVGHLVGLCEPDEVDEKYKKWRMDLLPMLPEKIPLKVFKQTQTQFNVVKKLMNDKSLMTKFERNPVSVIEELVGIDLPDQQVNQLIEGIRAKIKLDQVGDVLGGIGKLFGK